MRLRGYFLLQQLLRCFRAVRCGLAAPHAAGSTRGASQAVQQGMRPPALHPRSPRPPQHSLRPAPPCRIPLDPRALCRLRGRRLSPQLCTAGAVGLSKRPARHSEGLPCCGAPGEGRESHPAGGVPSRDCPRKFERRGGCSRGQRKPAVPTM